MNADYEYYTNGYLLGREPVIPDKVYPYWEKQACRKIDMYTFGCLNAHPELIVDEVKGCICEIAELLYKADSVAEQSLQQGGAGLLSSYSNDGESGNFDLSQSVYTESGKAGKIHEIIYRYLGNTGLLYRGLQL